MSIDVYKRKAKIRKKGENAFVRRKKKNALFVRREKMEKREGKRRGVELTMYHLSRGNWCCLIEPCAFRTARCSLLVFFQSTISYVTYDFGS